MVYLQGIIKSVRCLNLATNNSSRDIAVTAEGTYTDLKCRDDELYKSKWRKGDDQAGELEKTKCAVM